MPATENGRAYASAGGLLLMGLRGNFVDATLPALGCQIFMWRVATNSDSAPAQRKP